MPSRAKRLGGVLLGLILAVQLAVAAAATTPATVTLAEVQKAVASLEADPQLGAEETVKRLRWDSGAEEQPNETAGWLRRWLRWIGVLTGFLASVARPVWIVLAIVGIAFLAVLVWRAWNQQRGAGEIQLPMAPTHVRGLDIRPDTLPADIAAAASESWQRGEQRAALLLLYRGLLSRLVHQHRVAIRDSSTEGDCLRLAAREVDGERLRFVAELVSAWQAAVYALQWPTAEQFAQLCAGFRASLPVATRQTGEVRP